MTEKEKYELSTYIPVKTVHETQYVKVELVSNSLDGLNYIKKTYHSDKRAVFNAIAGIKNAHIPEIYGVYFGEDTIVIEQYIRGETIEELIVKGNTFSKSQTETVFSGLLEAIDLLHKNNIIHRDIKPSNVIITENGRAVLIDYSIARPYSDKRDSDTELFGTVGYAAPEQYGFSQSDYRTDIYAFGLTMKKIANRRNASKKLCNAIERCTEFDPSRRFQSVDEIRRYVGKPSPSVIACIAVGAAAVIAVEILLIYKFTELVHTDYDMEDLKYNSEQTEPAESDNILYEYNYTRIVNTSNSCYDIPCIQIWDNGIYEARVDVADSLPPLEITAEKKDGQCFITVDNQRFEFEDNYSPEALSYPDSSKIAEIIFYDMNDDGILDIIPVISDARVTEVNVLKNYSVAWCIYSDTNGGFKQADGTMYAYLEPFKIYDTLPGCLWADFPSYYVLKDGRLILYS